MSEFWEGGIDEAVKALTKERDEKVAALGKERERTYDKARKDELTNRMNELIKMFEKKTRELDKGVF